MLAKCALWRVNYPTLIGDAESRALFDFPGRRRANFVDYPARSHNTHEARSKPTNQTDVLWKKLALTQVTSRAHGRVKPRGQKQALRANGYKFGIRILRAPTLEPEIYIKTLAFGRAKESVESVNRNCIYLITSTRLLRNKILCENASFYFDVLRRIMYFLAAEQ